MNFIKMQAAGNDFVVLNGMKEKLENYSELALKLCHRKFGIGGDGLLIAEKSSKADIKMVYYNSDGSQSAMCGNGIRCFSKFLYEENILNKKEFTVETGDGVKNISLEVENNFVKKIKVSMGKAQWDPKKLPVNLKKDKILEEEIIIDGKKFIFSSVLTGVIHTVIFVEDFNSLDINGIGSKIEKHSLFPAKTNVNFVKVINPNKIEIKTWERGAGRTLACGTGSCGSVVLGNRLGKLSSNVEVHTEGGILNITLKDEEIFMEGTATTVFKGVI
ncbi:diaminopimelate epimerase [Cetobacterium sp. SF1]|uniref:diaminopimelate epimerase n=1 Tax=unclassified Cetobacterium TaxID=2630983 RepID=UPI003CEDB3CE